MNYSRMNRRVEFCSRVKIFLCIEPCETSEFTFRAKPEIARKNWVGIIPGIILLILSVLSGNFLSALLYLRVFCCCVSPFSNADTSQAVDVLWMIKNFVVLVLHCFVYLVSGNWKYDWCWRVGRELLQHYFKPTKNSNRAACIANEKKLAKWESWQSYV